MKNNFKMLKTVCFVSICSMLMFGLNANAYIDPSVMTYMIQVVAGIVVAVGAIAGVYFRKIKKKVGEKLGVDEYKNKEVETDDIWFDENPS